MARPPVRPPLAFRVRGGPPGEALPRGRVVRPEAVVLLFGLRAGAPGGSAAVLHLGLRVPAAVPVAGRVAPRPRPARARPPPPPGGGRGRRGRGGGGAGGARGRPRGGGPSEWSRWRGSATRTCAGAGTP